MSPAEIAVRERLLVAAIGLIRDHGLAGLTQPRVAKAAGISQSHLTYYFPTRQALLAAVLDRTATDQLAGVELAMRGASTSPRKLADAMGTAFEKAENSRVLISFALAASQDADVRAIFERLTRGIRGEVAAAADRIGIPADAKTVALVHALGVGLSVLNLALGGSTLRPKAAEAMARLFKLLAEEGKTRN